MDIPTDDAHYQYVTRDEVSAMDSMFREIAKSGENVTRLPKRKFDPARVNEAFEEAFELIGGVPRLALWAHNNQGEFYKLYGKMITSNIKADHNHAFQILPPLPRSALDGDYTDVTPESTDPDKAITQGSPPQGVGNSPWEDHTPTGTHGRSTF
jgi:hypothetical protein